MYCSNCGKDIPDALNYCNVCGAPTQNTIAAGGTKLPRVFAMGATFFAIIGIAALFPFLRMLLDSRLDSPSIGMFVLMYLVTVLLIFGTLIGMTWKVSTSGGRKDRPQKQDDQYRPPASFRGPNTAQLYPGDPEFGSVTDSTTRTLDEVFVERKS
jgi:hypothetical protein